MYFDIEPSLWVEVQFFKLISSSKIAKWGGCCFLDTNAILIFLNLINAHVWSAWIIFHYKLLLIKFSSLFKSKLMISSGFSSHSWYKVDSLEISFSSISWVFLFILSPQIIFLNLIVLHLQRRFVRLSNLICYQLKR